MQIKNVARVLSLAVERFDTSLSEFASEIVEGNSVRHFRVVGERTTFCGLPITEALPGYSSTCDVCSRTMKRIRQARSAEGQRRATERRKTEAGEIDAILDANWAMTEAVEEIDDAALSRHLRRRAEKFEQEGDGSAAYYLIEAARRIEASNQ